MSKHQEEEMLFPMVSVVIPSVRPSSLANTLNSLLSQKYPSSRIEISVIGKNYDELRSKYDSVKFIEKGDTPAKARNIGVSESKGDLTLFIDDDCVADQNLIGNVVKRFMAEEKKGSNIGAVGGRILGVSKAFFRRCADYAQSHEFMCENAEIRKKLCTSNMTIKREAFIRVNGFDEKIGVGEDLDISLKLRKKGYYLIYLPAAIVYHNHTIDSFRDLLQYFYGHGRRRGTIIEKKHGVCAHGVGIRLFYVNPLLYAIMKIFPGSLLGTFRIIRKFLRHDAGILLYAPFICLAYAFGGLGVLQSIVTSTTRR